MTNTSATGGTLLSVDTPITQALYDEELDLLFCAQVAAITGINPQFVVARWVAEPVAPAPIGQTWAAVGVMNLDPDQYPAQTMLPDGSYKLVHHERMDVMASFYGPKAMQAAQFLFSGVQIAQNRDVLNSASIDLRETLRPAKAPALINARWTTRWDVTLTLGRAVTLFYPVLPIAKVVGTVSTDSGLSRPLDITLESNT